MLSLKYSEDEIIEKRNKVYNEFIFVSKNVKTGVISKISNFDLRLLFELYDSIFLNGYFKQRPDIKIKFSLSRKMTKSAGKTIFNKGLSNMNLDEATFEIRMGVDFFFEYYETNRDKMVNGIKTKDSLTAFQLVFEHEICHLLELTQFKKSNCKMDRFRIIAFNIFGHKDVYHELPTNAETASVKYGFKIGDKVMFIFDNTKYEGFINNINKRATVMVKDKKGMYADKNNNRYTKYYVPLSDLRSN